MHISTEMVRDAIAANALDTLSKIYREADEIRLAAERGSALVSRRRAEEQDPQIKEHVAPPTQSTFYYSIIVDAKTGTAAALQSMQAIVNDHDGAVVDWHICPVGYAQRAIDRETLVAIRYTAVKALW